LLTLLWGQLQLSLLLATLELLPLSSLDLRFSTPLLGNISLIPELLLFLHDVLTLLGRQLGLALLPVSLSDLLTLLRGYLTTSLTLPVLELSLLLVNLLTTGRALALSASLLVLPSLLRAGVGKYCYGKNGRCYCCCFYSCFHVVASYRLFPRYR